MQLIFTGVLSARTAVNISSLSELRKASAASNQRITMKPGVYEAKNLHDNTTVFPDPPPGYLERYNRYAPKSYVAKEIQLENKTQYPVVIGEKASHNTISSTGPVKDAGSGNNVTYIPPAEASK